MGHGLCRLDDTRTQNLFLQLRLRLSLRVQRAADERGLRGDRGAKNRRRGARYRWPGPLHEGGGIVQGIISEQANDAQRDALFQILEGKEQEPTTAFNIVGSTIETEFDPIFADIEFAADLEARTGFFRVPGIMEMALEPIRNPVTGEAHPAQIVLPTGFEFRNAEMASGTFEASGDIALAGSGVYGYLTDVAYGPYGVIEEKSYRG
jgi:hypothetical protein